MYKALKDLKIIAINETGDFPCLVYDEIVEDNEHTCDEFVEIGGEFALKTDDKAIAYLQDYVRSIRNQYLVDYVDGAVSNPLRWADMSQELKDMYTNYRRYLLDYTDGENWWENLPKTLEEWRDGLGETA